jgi:hypothetical protein
LINKVTKTKPNFKVKAESAPKPLPRSNDYLRARTVEIVAKTYNRSPDWVYKVIAGTISNKNTAGVKEYYELEYKSLSENLNKLFHKL